MKSKYPSLHFYNLRFTPVMRNADSEVQDDILVQPSDQSNSKANIWTNRNTAEQTVFMEANFLTYEERNLIKRALSQKI